MHNGNSGNITDLKNTTKMERGEFSKRTPILVAVDAAVKVLSTILKVSSGGRGRYDEESTSNSDLSPFSLSIF